MTDDELHVLLGASELPFTIETKGGRSYYVAERSHIWIPEAYKEVLCLVLPGKGIIFLRLNAIESVQTEHDVAGAR